MVTVHTVCLLDDYLYDLGSKVFSSQLLITYFSGFN